VVASCCPRAFGRACRAMPSAIPRSAQNFAHQGSNLGPADKSTKRIIKSSNSLREAQGVGTLELICQLSLLQTKEPLDSKTHSSAKAPGAQRARSSLPEYFERFRRTISRTDVESWRHLQSRTIEVHMKRLGAE